MIKDLGGYIIDVWQQRLPPGHGRVGTEGLLEVRNELYVSGKVQRALAPTIADWVKQRNRSSRS